MEADDVAELYTVVAETFERPLSELACKGWQLALGPYDGPKVWAAVGLMLAEERPFMPKPGEVVAMVRRIDGDIPPTPDAALGCFLVGDLSHPLVAAAAASAYWDPNDPDKAVEARMRFRAAYSAEVDQFEDDKLRPVREAIEAGSAGDRLAQLLAGNPER